MNVEKRFKKENINKVTPNVSYSDVAPLINAKAGTQRRLWPKLLFPSATVLAAGIITFAVVASGSNADLAPAFINQETVSSQSAPVVINAIRTSGPSVQNAFLAAKFFAIDLGTTADDTSVDTSEEIPDEPAIIEEDVVQELVIELDAMITNDDAYVINELESDREEYPNLQEIHYTDVDGSAAFYNLYYNDAEVVEDVKNKKTHISTTYSGIATSGEIEFNFDVAIEKEIKMRKEEVTSFFTLHESENTYTIIEVNETAKKNKEDTAYVCTKVDNGVETKYSLKLGMKNNGNKVLILNYNGINYEVFSRVAGGVTYLDIQVNEEEKTTYVKNVAEDGTVSYELFVPAE